MKSSKARTVRKKMGNKKEKGGRRATMIRPCGRVSTARHWRGKKRQGSGEGKGRDSSKIIRGCARLALQTEQVGTKKKNREMAPRMPRGEGREAL